MLKVLQGLAAVGLVSVLGVVGCGNNDSGAGSNGGSIEPAVSEVAAEGGVEVTELAEVADAVPAAVEEAAVIDLDAVAVTVNDHDVTVGEVEGMMQGIIQQQSRGREIPANVLEQMRGYYQDRVVDILVDQYLVEERMEEAGMEISDEELQAQASSKALEIIEDDLNKTMERSGMSREELAAVLMEKEGSSLDEKIAEAQEQLAGSLLSDPGFKLSVLQEEYLQEKYGDELAVNADESRQYYSSHIDEFSTPEQVRASHILVKVEEGADEEAKAAAKKEIEDVLVKVNEADADFAALAKDYSACPSSAKGGDLGFFPRHGAMVEPFAEAAYGLEVGGVSDVVETRFGYHIIKVTEKKDAKVAAYEEAEAGIMDTLKNQKMGEVMQAFRDELREGATISYGVGYEREPAVVEIEDTEGTVVVPEK